MVGKNGVQRVQAGEIGDLPDPAVPPRGPDNIGLADLHEITGFRAGFDQPAIFQRGISIHRRGNTDFLLAAELADGGQAVARAEGLMLNHAFQHYGQTEVKWA